MEGLFLNFAITEVLVTGILIQPLHEIIMSTGLIAESNKIKFFYLDKFLNKEAADLQSILDVFFFLFVTK
jgi:hypothetical protein